MNFIKIKNEGNLKCIIEYLKENNIEYEQFHNCYNQFLREEIDLNIKYFTQSNINNMDNTKFRQLNEKQINDLKNETLDDLIYNDDLTEVITDTVQDTLNNKLNKLFVKI